MTKMASHGSMGLSVMRTYCSQHPKTRFPSCHLNLHWVPHRFHRCKELVLCGKEDENQKKIRYLEFHNDIKLTDFENLLWLLLTFLRHKLGSVCNKRQWEDSHPDWASYRMSGFCSWLCYYLANYFKHYFPLWNMRMLEEITFKVSFNHKTRIA